MLPSVRKAGAVEPFSLASVTVKPPLVAVSVLWLKSEVEIVTSAAEAARPMPRRATMESKNFFIEFDFLVYKLGLRLFCNEKSS